MVDLEGGRRRRKHSCPQGAVRDSSPGNVSLPPGAQRGDM